MIAGRIVMPKCHLFAKYPSNISIVVIFALHRPTINKCCMAISKHMYYIYLVGYYMLFFARCYKVYDNSDILAVARSYY